jgi:hypothetical protein
MKYKTISKEQLPLFPDAGGQMGKLETAFWKFHGEHPDIYGYLVRFARQWRQRRGENAHLGIKALFERVRWEMGLTSEIKESPKLNNNHTAFYARLIMDKNLDLVGIFCLRRQRIAASIGPENNNLPENEHVS